MTTCLSVETLYRQLALPDSPVLIDVREESEFLATPRLIPGAVHVRPEAIDEWAHCLPTMRRVAVYDTRGTGASHAVIDTLISRGHPAVIVDGGLDAWLRAGFATVRARNDLNAPGGSRWVTRERPKIDRLACPWLVRRFIDPDAAFFYTPAHRVRSDAQTLHAEPYDIADVTFSHRGRNCSFDAFLEEFDLHDPVLDQVAHIVRAADTGELGQSKEAPGLLAISLGLSANHADDFVLLEQAMPIYDALYAWCKTAHEETHSWPQKGSRA